MPLNSLHKPNQLFWRFLSIATVLFIVACSSDGYNSGNNSELGQSEPSDTLTINLLSLGDSYTAGTSVCDSCSFPLQLRDSLLETTDPFLEASVEILATSGWTTGNLLGAVNSSNLNAPYDLVTLLIGVNNQFQGQAFAIYDSEFTSLLEQSIALAGNDPDKVLVLSIPDYAFTPFGQNWGNPVNTSSEIDMYNGFAETVSNDNGVTFINITDISREGLSRAELVASDGLHLSEIAYGEIVSRIFPVVKEKIEEN